MASLVRGSLARARTDLVVIPIGDKPPRRQSHSAKQRKMSLADSILFATALENDWELASRNVNDFKWVASLRLLNPFDFRP
jgi:predicted nucleic acid-binding protein